MAVKALDNANVEVVAINENPDDVRHQKKSQSDAISTAVESQVVNNFK